MNTPDTTYLFKRDCSIAVTEPAYNLLVASRENKKVNVNLKRQQSANQFKIPVITIYSLGITHFNKTNVFFNDLNTQK